MNCSFSLYNYQGLLTEQKTLFNKALALKLLPFENEIKSDEDMSDLSFEEFFPGTGVNASSFVEEIYARITSGVQAGSGNQNLFLGVLNAFVEAWSDTIK